MSGWYVMHRGWMDSFKPEPFTEREAFLWSIEQAAIKDHDQWFNGLRVPVTRGQFATSLRTMSDSFTWSIKRVRGFMDRMGKAQKWAHHQAQLGAQSPTIITICNYDYYQRVVVSEGTARGTARGTPRAQQGHSKGTQQNKGNKGNKGNEDTPPPIGGGGAPAPKPDSAYRFAGTTIRLTGDDFDKWAKAYHAIPDLRAELMAIDAWFQTDAGAPKQKHWFHTTAGSLNRKHQEVLASTKQAKAFNPIPGGGTPISGPC